MENPQPEPTPDVAPVATVFEPKRRPALNGFRGLALIGTIAGHIAGLVIRPSPVGMDMFFTLSGFLITSILLVPARPIKWPTALAFWAARVRRLIPGLVFAAIGGAVLAVASGVAPYGEVWNRSLVTGVLYSANIDVTFRRTQWLDGVADPFGHLWSMGVEEQFYLFWPLILGVAIAVFGLQRRWRSVMWIGIVGGLASFAGMAWAATNWTVIAGYHFTPFRIGGVLFGAAVAGLIGSGKVTHVPWWGKLAAWTALFWGAGFLRWTDGFYYYGGSLLMTLASATLIGAFWLDVDTRSWSAKVMALPPFTYLGKISYSAYLWHLPVLVLAAPFFYQFTGSVPTVGILATSAVIATLIVATLSYRFIEQPIRTSRRLRDHVAPWKQIVVGLTVTALTAVLVSWILSPVGLMGAYRTHVPKEVLGTSAVKPGETRPLTPP